MYRKTSSINCTSSKSIYQIKTWQLYLLPEMFTVGVEAQPSLQQTASCFHGVVLGHLPLGGAHPQLWKHQTWKSYLWFSARLFVVTPGAPFTNLEVWEWIGNFIPHFIMGVIIYSCWLRLVYVGKSVSNVVITLALVAQIPQCTSPISHKSQCTSLQEKYA